MVSLTKLYALFSRTRFLMSKKFMASKLKLNININYNESMKPVYHINQKFIATVLELNRNLVFGEIDKLVFVVRFSQPLQLSMSKMADETKLVALVTYTFTCCKSNDLFLCRMDRNNDRASLSNIRGMFLKYRPIFRKWEQGKNEKFISSLA